MILNGEYDHLVLVSMGATRVSDRPGGVEVEPDFDVSGYQKAAAAFMSAHSLAQLRQERDARLIVTDWTQGGDTPLSPAKKAAWATYRQALRDLPANTPDPASPSWPSVPA